MDSFPIKDPGETLPVAFEFQGLDLAETLVTPTVTIITFAGVDATPNAVLWNVATISGIDVLQWVRAGVAGVDYKLTCSVITSAGRMLILTGKLPVRAA
jgi:hypothetical protein